MKRHHIIIGLLLSLVGVASAQNFRGLNWTLTKAQVLEQEIGFNFVGEVDSISEAGIDVIFAGELADLDTRLIYFFDASGALYRVAYGFTQVRPDIDTYLADFDRVRNILEASYGTPAVTDTWQSEGYFSYTWETADTIMIHALLRTETGVGHAIDLVKK
ncbi:MAG: hypothetical protein AAF708_04740 [Deinococcota bacterium]